MVTEVRPPSRATSEAFVGRWLVTGFDQWDHDFLDRVVPAYIAFETDGTGTFQFGVVQGRLEARVQERNGKPFTEFTWEGGDEDKAANGRGWAALDDAHTMKGHLYIHDADDSGFAAARSSKKSKAKRTARSRR